jgi:predicted DCC family thiol-disulfide oxidoreductase YuxK
MVMHILNHAMQLYAILLQAAISTQAEMRSTSCSDQRLSETFSAISHYDRLVIYDSTCPMCSTFIRFLDSVYRDTHFNVMVAPSVDFLLKRRLSIPHDAVTALSKTAQSSLILIKEHSFNTKSTAVLELLLDSNNCLLAFIAVFCKAVIPARLADFVYDRIASKRYLLSRCFQRSCSLGLRNIYQL